MEEHPAPEPKRRRGQGAVRKGKGNETKCAEELRKEGYIVWQTIRTRFHNNDIFNLFDVLGLERYGFHLRFIQVKTNRCEPETYRAIKALQLPVNCYKEIWIWKDRQGWKKEVIP